MNIRLLDLGRVSCLHSQTIYHAVAYCTVEDSPGTIALLSPREPYVSIGYHQVLENEIDVEYCAKHSIPILRREVGGGAVYLDKDQLFFQCIFPKEKTPLNIDNLYKLFLAPAINTYRRLGIDAYRSPGNDIQVGEKKICGTGAGRIGQAMVVVGNIIFDFNYGEMARALRVPSEDYRRQVYDSMNIYMTTLRRELGHVPDKETVKNMLIDEFENVLNGSLKRGSLNAKERQVRSKLNSKFTNPEWLYQKGGKINNGVKINSDVWVRESTLDSPQGCLKVILRLKGDTIDDILILDTAAQKPMGNLRYLEKQLIGQPLESASLSEMLESFFADHGIQSPGLGAEKMLKAIMGETK